MKRIFAFTLKHKIISLNILAIIITASYLGYREIKPEDNNTSYITETVKKGMLISSISGVGQVSALDQVDIKPRASGDVISVNVKSDQEIKEGDLIAQIDSSEAQKAVREAQIALETIRVELNELLGPPDELDLLKAENALAIAKRNLEELINPSESDLFQAENSLITAQVNLTKLKFNQESDYQKAQKAKQTAEDDLKNANEDGFNTTANAFFDLPDIMAGLKDVLFTNSLASNQWNIDYYTGYIDKYDSQASQYKNAVYNSYQTARIKYEKNLENYKSTSRYSDISAIEKLTEETHETTKAISEAIRNAINLLDIYEYEFLNRNPEIPSICLNHQSDLKSYTSKTNSILSSLLSIQRSLEDGKEAILDAKQNLKEMDQDHPLDLAEAERNAQEKEEALDKLKNPEQYEIDAAQIAVKEKELTLENLKAGADELNIRTKKNTVQQKAEALLTAQQNLADCNIRAPFDGVIAQVDVKKGDSVSGSAILASIITKQKIAKITLNEIDVAQVKVGQKATLQFDAAPDLSITGKVAEVDTLGAVTQNVVSYGVKIAFDVDDERIKPGMTVSTSIIIDSKQNILLIPLSAVKAMGNSSYVEVLVNGQPQSKTIVTGLSNDIMIEIVSGLEQGEEVISQTISNGAAQGSAAQGQNQSSGAMQGMMRMMR
ncbi:efflux RND transporter periplasmic adaptor subunit [Patescibacteria group bacterium]|nr:efflux RND transporter periplasmic adaptor subunit [Patescibacteria group bacterium]